MAISCRFASSRPTSRGSIPRCAASAATTPADCPMAMHDACTLNAEPRIALDQHGLRTSLGGRNRRADSCRPATNHSDIELRSHD